MNLTDFTKYWSLTYQTSTSGDPANLVIDSGSASFYVGDQGYIGIKQYSLTKGITYNFQLKISGSNLGSSFYFTLCSNNNTLYFLSSSGEYNIPLTCGGNDIELRYYGNDISYTNPGQLFYIRALAPRVIFSENENTPLGPVTVGHSDGKEDFNGELKGSQILTTYNTRKSNPFLNYNYVSSSIIPNSQIFNPSQNNSSTTNNPLYFL